MKMQRFVLCFVTFLINFAAVLCVNNNHSCKTQAQLLDDLKANSTINVFPVKDPTSSIDALASIDFLHLLHVDILQQQITIRVWVALQWVNEFVHWNSDDFCGVTHVLSSGDKNLLWFPDVILPELASNEEILKSSSAQMRITEDGRSMICRYATVFVTCQMESWKFPYDKHECKLSLKADADTTDKLMLEASNLTGKSYMNGDVWDILSYDKYNDVDVEQVYSGTSAKYSKITYTLRFQRQGNFIFTIICLPGTLINFLCIAAFFLPNSSGDKIGLTVTLFLAQTVNLMLFAEYLPPGGNAIPLVGQYLVLSIVMTAFSVLYAVYDSRISESEENDNDDKTQKTENRDQKMSDIKSKPNNSMLFSRSGNSTPDPRGVNSSPNLNIKDDQFYPPRLRFGYIFPSRNNSISPTDGPNYLSNIGKEVSDVSSVSSKVGTDNVHLVDRLSGGRGNEMSGKGGFWCEISRQSKNDLVGYIYAFVNLTSTVVYILWLFVD